MKKAFCLLTMLLAMILLVSCAESPVSSDSSTEYSSETTDSTTDNKGNDAADTPSFEDYTHAIYEEETNYEGKYYHKINQHGEDKDKPNDGVFKGQWYFEMLDSKEKLDEHILLPDVDVAMFEDHYVVRIYTEEELTQYDSIVGFYGLKCENGEYSINCDMYRPYVDGYVSAARNEFFIVPKTEVEFVSGAQKINVIENCAVSHPVTAKSFDKDVELPHETQVYLLKANEENKYDLPMRWADCDISGRGIVLYLSNEEMLDLLITDAKIENGDLHININVYLNSVGNSYLGKNKFLQLNDIDTSLLSCDYQVYITLNNINVKEVTDVTYVYSEADAVWKAEQLFAKKFKEELPEGYIYETEVFDSSENRFWEIIIIKKQEIDGFFIAVDGPKYRCLIEKSTFDIYACHMTD